jgi:hypothetical protein
MGRGWGGDEDGEISLRATWDQGGRDPITSRRVSKKVKENGREAKGNQKREAKQGDCAIICCQSMCMYKIIACNCLNVECN